MGRVMVLITGHRGFVGSHLCAALQARNIPVIGIDLKEGTDILTADLPDVDRVYHLAAQTNAQTGDAAADARVNIVGTLRLLERYGTRVVFASSSAVNYPVTPYAISKRAGEDYARIYGAAVVRFCNLHGPGGHGVFECFAAADVMVIRGDGNQLRTYAPVSLAVSALIAAMPGDLNILPGVDMTVRDIAAMHPTKPVAYVPAVQTDIRDGRQKAA